MSGPASRNGGISRSSTFAGPSLSPGASTVTPEHITSLGPIPAITFVSPPQLRNRSRAGSVDGTKSPGSSLNQCTFGDDHKVVCYSDIFQAPVVRQWLQDGRLYREAEERIPSRYELFFDLLLVGVVHQLADAAAENVSGLSVAKVVLTFYPAWSIWADLRNWLNTSGVDDVVQRIHTLIIMILLIGYSANASAIEVMHEVSETVESATRLMMRAESEGEIEVHEGPQRALIAAVTFFLVAKAFRLIVFLHYAYALPEFREAHLYRAGGTVLVSLIFMGIIWAPSLKAAAILAAFGIATEIGGRLTIGVFATLERKRAQARERLHLQRSDAGMVENNDGDELPQARHRVRMIPAINIEHMIERNNAFITVVLGESVVSLLYVASTGTIGASRTFGRSALALTVTFIFNALYYSALSKRFVHAIRRHWTTNVVWDTLTWPISTALILASAAVSKIVTEEATPRGVKWQYGCGLGTALLCITASQVLHRSLDVKGASRLSQIERAVARVVVSIIFCLIPLAKDLSDLSFLLVYAGVAGALAIFEVWAMVGAETEEEDHHPVDVEEEEDIEEAREAARDLARQISRNPDGKAD